MSSSKFDWASPQRIADASAGAFAIGCAIEEHVMFSGLRAYRDGKSAWAVVHDASNGIYDLTVSGSALPGLDAIRERLTREQDDEGAAEAGVDTMFDAPVELGAAVCRFRHDEIDRSWCCGRSGRRPDQALPARSADRSGSAERRGSPDSWTRLARIDQSDGA